MNGMEAGRVQKYIPYFGVKSMKAKFGNAVCAMLLIEYRASIKAAPRRNGIFKRSCARHGDGDHDRQATHAAEVTSATREQLHSCTVSALGGTSHANVQKTPDMARSLMRIPHADVQERPDMARSCECLMRMCRKHRAWRSCECLMRMCRQHRTRAKLSRWSRPVDSRAEVVYGRGNACRPRERPERPAAKYDNACSATQMTSPLL